MNYARIYDEFIQDRRARGVTAGVGKDRHHINPQCLGGGNEASNLVDLSHSDHLFAHILLAKIHGGVLLGVAMRMSGMKKYNGGRVSRARYQYLREEFCRSLRGNTLGTVNKGVPKTAEHRKRIGDAQRGRKLSPEQVAAMSASRKGKRLSEEHKARISAGSKGKQVGKIVSEQTRKKQGLISSARIAKAKEQGTYVPPALGMRHTAESKARIAQKAGPNAKRQWADPGNVERVRQSNLATWARPEKRAEHGDIMREVQNRPEVKAKVAQANVSSWKDPAVREKRLAGMRAAAERKRQEKEQQ